MGEPSMLTREEFLTHVEYIRKDIAGVQERMDVLNGRTRENEQDIAVLKDRANDGKRAGQVWGAGVGTAVAAILSALWSWFGGK